jgi:hypothetical protein
VETGGLVEVVVVRVKVSLGISSPFYSWFRHLVVAGRVVT